ncbi:MULTISPECIES: HIT family protein [Acinetobacter]|uniref:HIT domain-containing protein n=1 Tax=Acinetobacter chengduensis TaxID=2420890 RepID=A0ABX9TVJ5_9GAMM|nr:MULTISPECIES: HIT family protein [Acinetobacter]MBI1452588.1 HIT family protein [Acinetobacter sp. FL51]RKG40231.1 HIT family protein [Acinetobacter sp. WCHAc060007]RLL21758.1 HIT domain-containing protein [Acinetobacter chengduensis]
MNDMHCPYCDNHDSAVLAQNEFGMILPEPQSLSKGHCVIIPIRHVSSFFEITDKERKSLMSLLEQARNELNLIHQPAGFHIGFNDGKAFGTQAQHLHIHVIPYYDNQDLVLDQRWGKSAQL